MRVLYLHQYFVPPEGAGGTRSYEFARRLIAAGDEVIMITSSAHIPAKYLQRSGKRLISRVKIAGIPVVVIHVPYSQKMGYVKRIGAFIAFALLSCVQVLKYRADVVFATSTPLTIAIPGIVARFRHRIPLVFEVRDLWPEAPIAIGALHNPVLIKLAEALEWVAYRSSSQVIALAPRLAEGIVRRGVPQSDVTVIPNSCDVELFDIPGAEGQEVRRSLQLSEGQPLIVYTGSFGRVNGLDYLVQVAAAMLNIAPQTRFLLVGEGVQGTNIRSLAEELGVLDVNLWIWKQIPKHEVPKIVSAATIATSFVVPIKALWPDAANKFFDALAAAKPVAINYGGWQAEIIEQSGVGVVIPPDDPQRAAQLLSAFVHDSERLRKASEAARALAYTRFHRDSMAAKLRDVLARAVQNSRQ